MLGLPVVAVLRLRDLLTHLEATGETAILAVGPRLPGPLRGLTLPGL